MNEILHIQMSKGIEGDTAWCGELGHFTPLVFVAGVRESPKYGICTKCISEIRETLTTVEEAQIKRESAMGGSQ